jgi:hypothetical protein
MHHISVRIIHDSDSDDSVNELSDSLYHDIGDSDIFLQMWQGTDPAAETPSAPLASVHRAYEHMKSAMLDVSSLRATLRCLSARDGLSMSGTREAPAAAPLSTSYCERISHLGKCGDVLLRSAESLRAEVAISQSYFRQLSELSQRFPLKLSDDRISIASSTSCSTSIVVSEGADGLEWSLSDDSVFSVNSESFDTSASSYLRCFFELMCHELFERLKNDKNKCAIHYSADQTTRSVCFDVGNSDTNWLFELGPIGRIAEGAAARPIPVWIPSLIGLVMQPGSQPATFMRQQHFYKNTLDAVWSAFCGRFLSADFCTFLARFALRQTAFQIDSVYLAVPYVTFIDQTRVAMTETPNELRCVPYSTDVKGLATTLGKWCDTAFATLFLAMAESVARSLGFVFKHKNIYGTATNGAKKIRFAPKAGTHDVDITIIAKNSLNTRWSEVPGTDHLMRMSVVLFLDLSNPSV